MSDSLDVNLVIYKAIYDALENDTKWQALVPEGNRIRTDALVDPQRSSKPAYADADANQCRMRLRSGATGLRTTDVTFGSLDDVDCDTTEKLSFVYRIKLTSQLMTEQESSSLVTETVRVIRELGPRLGLPYVVGVRLRWETNESDMGAGEEDGQDTRIRQVTNMDVSVDVEVDSSELRT